MSQQTAKPTPAKDKITNHITKAIFEVGLINVVKVQIPFCGPKIINCEFGMIGDQERVIYG